MIWFLFCCILLVLLSECSRDFYESVYDMFAQDYFKYVKHHRKIVPEPITNPNQNLNYRSPFQDKIDQIRQPHVSMKCNGGDEK